MKNGQRRLTRLPDQVGVALASLVVLLQKVACGTSQVVKEADAAPGAVTTRATLDASPITPIPDAQREEIGPATAAVPPRATLIPSAPMAPGFELPDVDGTTWSLAQFRGRPVMLFFWATW